MGMGRIRPSPMQSTVLVGRSWVTKRRLPSRWRVLMTKAEEKTAARLIEDALNRGVSKSDKARLLFELGLTKVEVAAVVPMNYSQAHSVWKGMADGRTGHGHSPADGSTRSARGKTEAVSETSVTGPPDLHFRSPHHSLNLTPSQTRIVKQDGHWVLKDVNEQGTKCRSTLKSGEICGRLIVFSIRELAFVHADSKKPITEMEERYA